MTIHISLIQDLGLFSLLSIARSLGKLAVPGNIQIEVVTNNMQEVVGGEVLYPEKAAVLGAVKVIPLEYFNIKCRSIDLLEQDLRARENDALVDRLLREFTSHPSENVAAYRGDYRWVECFKPVHLAHREPGLRLKEKGVYLVTGGLGGMGFPIAEFLAKNYDARLILVNRSQFPSASGWDKWLASHDEADEKSIKIRKLQDMQRNGSEVLIFSADVSDEQQMKEIAARGEERFGEINGIIHTAGVIDYNGVIQRRTREMTEDNMAAKVKGTIVLEDVFKDKPLDFMVLFSSIGNVNYGAKFGQVGYNAGNEFLDAYAFYKPDNTPNHIHKLAVNWCDWLEVGMTVRSLYEFYKDNPAKRDRELEDLKNRALSPEEGVNAFSVVLNSSLHRVIISPTDLYLQLEEMERDLENIEESTVERLSEMRDKDETYYVKPELTTTYVPPGNQLERLVVDTWQDYLGYDKIGINDNLFELGVGSLDIVQVNSRLKKHLGREIQVVVMFEYPTIASLVKYFETLENEENTAVSMEQLPDRQEKIDKGKDKLKRLRRTAQKN
jgi:acyl carrier protein